MARRSPRARSSRSTRGPKGWKPIFAGDRRPMVEFRDTDTYYGELHVLKKVNYQIKRGEIVCLLGGNASGKSTTMKTVLGIVRPKAGTVLFEGAPINTMPTVARVRRG